MTDLETYLTTNNIGRATADHAVHYLLAELTDFLPPEAMLAELQRVSGQPEALQHELNRLCNDGELLSELDFVVLKAAWNDEASQPLVPQALSDAQDKLPVIELGALAIVAMYGMYLYTTKGVQRRRRVYSETGKLLEEETEYYGPGDALRSIVDLFVPGAAGAPTGEKSDEPE